MQSTQMTNYLVMSLAFTSGFIIMCVELLGGRILSPYFGSSIYVWGSVITIFMLALSIGYLLGGRWSLNNPNLARYSIFFLVAAVALIPTILWGDAIMDQIFLHVEDPRYGSLIASAIIFFVPTVILGMGSPYSVRLLVENREHSGQVAGRLYFVSTAGSALGTLATSFYLVLWFEVNSILISAALVLTACGGIAQFWHHFRTEESEAGSNLQTPAVKESAI